MEELSVGQIAGSVAGIVTLLSVFFEITPIKFNPISMFLNWVGKKMTSDLKERVDMQNKKIDAFQEEVEKSMALQAEKFTEHEMNNDKHEMRRIREEIFDFSNACQNKRKHTRRQFAHIIELYEEYEALIEKWGLTNGQIAQEMEYIKALDLRLKHNGGYLDDETNKKEWLGENSTL